MTTPENSSDLAPGDAVLFQSIFTGFGYVDKGIQNNINLRPEERSELRYLISQPFLTFEELVTRLETDGEQLSVGSPLRQALVRLDNALSRMEQEILDANRVDTLDYLRLLMLNLGEAFIQWMTLPKHKVPPPTRREIRFARQLVETATQSLELMKERESVKRIQAEVQQIAEDVQEAAGTTASSEVASFYQERADKERLRYLAWNILFFVASIASATIGWLVVSRSTEAATLTAHEFARITIAVPVIILAAYAARQASFHRNCEAEANLIAVQLKTVRAYSDAVDPSSKHEILRMLGAKIFGPPVAQTSNEVDGNYLDVSPLAGLPPALLEELKKLVPGQRAGSSP